MDSPDEIEQRELMLARFRKLIGELMQGRIRRTVFEPWEIEILLDLEGCALPRLKQMGILRRYLNAVQRQLEVGSGPPMKLSEYLQRRSTRRPVTE